jgi:hypothetical protein
MDTHPKARSYFARRVATLRHLLDRRDLEFLCVPLSAHTFSLCPTLWLRSVYDSRGDSDDGRLISHYEVRKFCKLDFSLAPQLVTSSSNAIKTPLMRWRLEPLVIVQPVCPGTGQLQESPTQATGIPPTLKLVARVLITLPP